MGWWSTRTREEELDRKAAKIQRYTLSGSERRKLKRHARGRKLVDSSGQILNMAAMKSVGRLRDRINRQQCPGCGRPQKRKGTMCPSCVSIVPDAGEIKKWEDSLSLYDEQGRNKNGIRYDKHGKRIWD